MSKDNHKLESCETTDRITKATETLLAKHISCDTHHENLVQMCLEYKFRGHASVRATQYGGERGLRRYAFLGGTKTQGSRPAVKILSVLRNQLAPVSFANSRFPRTSKSCTLSDVSGRNSATLVKGRISFNAEGVTQLARGMARFFSPIRTAILLLSAIPGIREPRPSACNKSRSSP